MVDPLRDDDPMPGHEAADPARSPSDVRVDEEAVGYARADLEDALARIRGTIGPSGLGDLDPGPALRPVPDDERRLIEQIRALGDRVERLAAIAEAATERTTDLSTASSRVDERVNRLTDAIEKAQAAQDRSDERMRWLSVAVAVLTVILAASLVVDVL